MQRNPDSCMRQREWRPKDTPSHLACVEETKVWESLWLYGGTVPLRSAKQVAREGQLRRYKRNPAKAGTSLVAQALQKRGAL
jgi:hypothetical protein